MKTYTCPAGKIPQLCSLRKRGFSLDSCPLIKTGIYADQVFPIDNRFFQQDIIKESYIQLLNKNEQIIYQKIPYLPREHTYSFWDNFSGLFQKVEKAHTLFQSIKTLCNDDSTAIEKSLAFFNSLDVFINRIKNDDPIEDKKAMLRLGIGYGKDKAIELIKQTSEYQNASDKIIYFLG